MKYYIYLFIFIISFSTLELKSQIKDTSEYASDTLLFVQLLRKPWTVSTNIELMKRLYKKMSMEQGLGSRQTDEIYSDFISPNVITLRGHFQTTVFASGRMFQFLETQRREYGANHMAYRRILREDFKEKHNRCDDINSEKAQLTHNLRVFDSLSVHKPIFFATIYSQYNGDYAAYVNDLYSKSIMGSKRNLRKFLSQTSPDVIQNDLGYQFSLSLALYEQWIAQVRNGEVEE